MKVDVAAFNKDLVVTFIVIVKLQTSRRFVSSSGRYLLDQVVKSRSVRRPMVAAWARAGAGLQRHRGDLIIPALTTRHQPAETSGQLLLNICQEYNICFLKTLKYMGWCIYLHIIYQFRCQKLR